LSKIYWNLDFFLDSFLTSTLVTLALGAGQGLCSTGLTGTGTAFGFGSAGAFALTTGAALTFF